MPRWTSLALCLTLCGLAMLTHLNAPQSATGQTKAAPAGRVFEMRTYIAAPDKMDALHARFRNHTLKLFEKHGMKNVIYLSPADEKQAANTMVYLISHESREAADKAWAAFRADPDWIAARDASEKDGKLVAKVISEFFTATDYSPVK